MTHMVHGGVVRGGGDPGEFVARHATKNNTFVGNPPMNSNGPWEEEMSFPKWSALLPSQILRSRSSFASFLRTSFSLHRSSTSTPTTLFPIPVPDGGYFDRMSPGAGRKKGALLIGRLLHIITMAFNFWHFGGDFVPAELLGRAPSSVHRRFYARVRAFIKSESQSSTFSVAKAGRRFPQLVARLCDLSLSLTKLGASGEPYGRTFQGYEVPINNDRPELEPYRSLDPERLVVHGQGHWDVTSFLDDSLAMAYRDPHVLTLNRVPQPFEYPAKMDSLEATAALCKLWDGHNLLMIHDEPILDERPYEAVRIFNCLKSSTQDRQIGDRRGRNSVEAKVAAVSTALPSSTDMVDIEVRPRSQRLWLYASDRKDFYHQIAVTRQRALTNTLGPGLPVEWVSDTEAYRLYAMQLAGYRYDRSKHGDLLGAGPVGRRKASGTVYASFKAILQGDHAGVEIATMAHANLLASVGCLQEGSRLVAHRPLHSHGLCDGLVIDDYFCLCVEDGDVLPHCSKGAALHSRAMDAYTSQRLLGSPQKDIVGEDHGRIIGGYINAEPATLTRHLALLGAPMEKRLGLSWLTLQVLQLGACTDVLFLCLLGGWVSTLMYRRPFMGVLSQSFHVVDLESYDPGHPRIVTLSRSVRDELVMLAAFAPLLQTNLAADFEEKIFCSDASLDRGAVLEAPLDEKRCRVLHRALRSKGAYTKLTRATDRLLQDDLDTPEDVVTKVNRPPAFRYDFIEVYSGASLVSHYVGSFGHVVGPPLDLSSSEELNLSYIHVLSWLVHMLEQGWLLAFMVEPPCTTFTIMRRPPLRSKRLPYGFRPREAKTQTGNQLAQRGFQLMHFADAYDASGILETPNSSLLKNLPSWGHILGRRRASMCRTDSCRFGSPHQKAFKFLGVGVNLEKVSLRCQCKGPHLKVEGRYTKSSATYTPQLSAALADVFHHAILAKKSKFEETSVDGPENLLVNEVMKTARWSVRADWKFKKSSHINILELSALLKLVSSLAFERGSKRIIACVDSLVTRGAANKGRSSSYGLTNVLRQISTTILAADLYLTIPFVPTRLNSSDDPTRLRQVRSPQVGMQTETWEEDELYKLVEHKKLRRFAANWCSLVFGLLGPKALWFSDRSIYRHLPSLHSWPSPYHQLSSPMDFDSTLGFPGEGPLTWALTLLALSSDPLPFPFLPCCPLTSGRVLAMPMMPRNAADRHRQTVREGRAELIPGRRVRPETSDLRRSLMFVFEEWARHEGVDWPFLLANSYQNIEEINNLLERYGQVLYRSGRPYLHFAETLNAIANIRPSLKRNLQGAWNLAFGWVQSEPSDHHVAMPFQILLAMLSVCAIWGWLNFGGCVALAFSGFLRPGEMLGALRKQLMLPIDVGNTVDFGLFSIWEPKTRYTAARHQSTKIDIPDMLQYIQLTLGPLQKDQRLWPMSGQTFRLRFKAVLQEIGIQDGVIPGVKQLDPGSLRAGGATWALTMTEDAELIRRRGQWLTAKTMEIYIQEVSATLYMSQLPANTRDRILILAGAFPAILGKMQFLSDCKISQCLWRFLHP